MKGILLLLALLVAPLLTGAEEGIWETQPGEQVTMVHLGKPAAPAWRDRLSQWQLALRSRISQQAAALDQSPSQPLAWGLLALALAYGVLHAAGPGHGKAVVVSLMIVNEGHGWRQGLALGFAVALLENASALGLVYTLYFFTTSHLWQGVTELQAWLQPLAYSGIMAIGAWLALKRWRKLKAIGQPHRHTPGEVCIHERVWQADSWPAALSFALIPCPGTVILLMFLLSFQLVWLGVWLTAALALGMALTLCALALAAVLAKGRLLAWAGRGEAATRFKARLELAGALAVIASAGLLWLVFGSQGFA